MKKERINIIVFIFITLSCGWLGVLIDSFLEEQPEGNSLGMGIWLIFPFLTAIILRIISKDKKDIGINPNFKGNLKWYGLSFFIYPLITLLCILIAALFRCLDTSLFSLQGFIVLAVTSILSGFIKNIFEEFSWRGYLTPKLLDLKINDWLVYIISGSVWGLWHAAYYMVFLPDSYFETTSRGAFLVMGVIFMIIWSIMFTEILRLVKSVWPCVLMHAIEDAVPTALFIVGGYLVLTGGSSFWLDPTTGIFATICFLVIGLLIRKIRIKKEKESLEIVNNEIKAES